MKTATLNVTHAGRSEDLPAPLPYDIGDEDIRRISEETLGLDPGTFENFVVDRFDHENGPRLYLRPKVPFGAGVVPDPAVVLREFVSDIEATGGVVKVRGGYIAPRGRSRLDRPWQYLHASVPGTRPGAALG